MMTQAQTSPQQPGAVFASEFATEHNTPPFSLIGNADYEPAISAGIEKARKELADIASNPEAPTFDNTIVALDRAGRDLDRVLNVFFNLLSADTDDEMMEISLRVTPLLADYSSSIVLDQGLWKRVKTVYDSRSSLNLTPEQKTLLQKTYDSFAQSGANLAGDDREKYRKLSAELSELTTQFGQNVLKELSTYEIWLTADDLAGLPESSITAAAEAAKAKGYDVLEMNGPLDNHYINWYESKNQGRRFVRVDSDVIDKLIQKENSIKMSLTETQQEILRPVFESQMPKDEKIQYNISFEAMEPDEAPVVITQNEFMRRMKEMAAMNPGMNFYGELPDSYNLVVNTEHPLIVALRDKAGKELDSEVNPLADSIDSDNAAISEIRKAAGDKAPDAEGEQKIKELEKAVGETRERQNKIVADYAAGQPVVKQLIDLALLGNGLLRGEALNEFIKRSVSLLA